MSHRGHHHGVGRGGEIDGKKGWNGSFHCCRRGGQASQSMISAYPITPQTHIVEHLSDGANGEMDAELFGNRAPALSVCLGAAATGARAFLHEFSG
jgi:pyruvate/2-oxoacid:ferredoxin oxidoreductase alpha subunit